MAIGSPNGWPLGGTADPTTVANTSDVADSTARLALTYGTGEGEVQVGDLVRQTDTGVVYMLAGNTPSNAAHWQQMSALPASILASGQVALARGGTGADLSATGGAGQVLKQSTAGGAVSVGALSASDMPSGIDAAKIGGGAVNNTELGYLDGVTSSIQTQLNGKAASSHSHAVDDLSDVSLALPILGGHLLAWNGIAAFQNYPITDFLSASVMPSGIDAVKIGGGAVSNTEFGYLDGVTSSIQTQLNGKAASSHSHAAANITSGQLAVARGGTGADLTTTGGAGQVLKQSTAGGAVSVGALTASEMGAIFNTVATNDIVKKNSSGELAPSGLSDDGSKITVSRLLDLGSSTAPTSSQFGEGRSSSTWVHNVPTSNNYQWRINGTECLLLTTSLLSSTVPLRLSAAVALSSSEYGLARPSSLVTRVSCADNTTTSVQLARGNTPVLSAWSAGVAIGGAHSAAPARQLEVLDSATAQVRLTHTAGMHYVDLSADGSGNLTIAPSGSMATLACGLRIVLPTVPTTSSDTGSSGTIAWDTNYLYVCTATNAWKRVALSTW